MGEGGVDGGDSRVAEAAFVFGDAIVGGDVCVGGVPEVTDDRADGGVGRDSWNEGSC